MDVPHLKFPLVLLPDGRLGQVEQDSAEDVVQCVRVILRTPRGWREDIPDMGLPNPAFRKGGADLVEIERQIKTYEERADSLVDEDPSALVDALAEVDVQIAAG